MSDIRKKVEFFFFFLGGFKFFFLIKEGKKKKDNMKFLFSAEKKRKIWSNGFGASSGCCV